MLQQLLKEAKGNRKEYIASLMKNITERTPAYSGAQITRAAGNALKIKLTKSQTDLSRFQSLTYSSRHLYLKDSNTVIPVD